MPQPVTALAGSDAYLGHQKQDVGEFNPSCPEPRDVVCALPQGIQERQEEATHSEVLEEPVVETAIHARVCGILHGEPSSVVSRAPRHVVGVYFVAFVAVSTPTKATKDLAFPAVYCTPPLSMTLCGDYGNETRPSTHLHTALYLSPDVNATAGGKISRRAIYRRNNA